MFIFCDLLFLSKDYPNSTKRMVKQRMDAVVGFEDKFCHKTQIAVVVIVLNDVDNCNFFMGTQKTKQ